jgi:hypothetical protein
LSSTLLVLRGLNTIVLKLISFVQNIFYIYAFLGQSLDQWFIIEQMVQGYLNSILTCLVGWAMTPRTGSMDFIGTIGTIGISLFQLW